jgi:hypothetical protein
VLRLRSRSVSISGKTEETESVIERNGIRTIENFPEDVLFLWTEVTSGTAGGDGSAVI